MSAEQVPMSTLLTGLGRETTARVRRAMRPLGLGAQEFLVLKQLQLLGETSQAELAERAGELEVRRVVDRAGDHRDGILRECLAERRQQLAGRPDPVAAGAEALRIRDEVGVAEPRVTAAADLELHLPRDQPVLV